MKVTTKKTYKTITVTKKVEDGRSYNLELSEDEYKLILGILGSCITPNDKDFIQIIYKMYITLLKGFKYTNVKTSQIKIECTLKDLLASHVKTH